MTGYEFYSGAVMVLGLLGAYYMGIGIAWIASEKDSRRAGIISLIAGILLISFGLGIASKLA